MLYRIYREMRHTPSFIFKVRNSPKLFNGKKKEKKFPCQIFYLFYLQVKQSESWVFHQLRNDFCCSVPENTRSSDLKEAWSVISSVTQSCSTLYDSMDCSMPGLPDCHQFLEFTQIHVHWVGDAIQTSHLLLSPSSPAINLFQHQGLFKWVSSLHQVAKVLEFQLQQQSFQWTPRRDLLEDGLVGSPCSPRDSQESSATPQFKSTNSLVLIFFVVQLSHPYMTTGKTIALTRQTFVGKVMPLLFNMPSRLVIAFLPRRKHLLISWLQSPSAVILEPKKESLTVSPSICHEAMGPDAMILVFWMLSFKPPFSLFSFTFIKRLFSFSTLSAISVLSSAYLRLLIFLSSLCFI